MSYGKGYDQLREQMKKQGATGGNLGGVYTKPYTPPKTYTQPVAAPQQANPYESYLRRMEAAAESQRAAQDRLLQQQYDTGVKEIRGYEGDLLRQAEIQNRVSQNQLPQQAALMGSGGLSESSLMGLDAQLGENRTRISNEALSQIGGLRGKLQAGQAANTNAYYDKLMGIMQQGAQAELSRQSQLAQASRAAAGGSATASRAKPYLTLAQALEAQKQGVNTQNVQDALSYYYGDEYAPQSKNMQDFESALERNLSSNSWLYQQGGNQLDGIAAAIQSQLNSGRLTRDEAMQLARKYGINVQ